MNHIDKRCQEDQSYANSLHAQNYIGTVLYVSFLNRILFLSIFILNTSYIVGMFWLVMCHLVEPEFGHGKLENSFPHAYDLESKSLYE